MLFAVITTLCHWSVHHLSPPLSSFRVFTNLVSVAGWLHVPAMLKKHQLFLLSWINSLCQCMRLNVVSVNQFCFNHLICVLIRMDRNSEADPRASGGHKGLLFNRQKPWAGPGSWGDPSAEDEGRGEGEIEKKSTSITGSGGHQWS